MFVAPPYVNKLIEKLELELLSAEKELIKAEKNVDFLKEYRDLCAKKLEAAKKEDANKEI